MATDSGYMQQRLAIDDADLESFLAWHGNLVGYSSLTLLLQELVRSGSFDGYFVLFCFFSLGSTVFLFF